jgi:hypothetical protein
LSSAGNGAFNQGPPGIKRSVAVQPLRNITSFPKAYEEQDHLAGLRQEWTLRVAILSMLLAVTLPASAQEDQIRYGNIEGIWVTAEDIFEAAPQPSISDCDLINSELTLTIDGRSIHGKNFTCSVKHAQIRNQAEILSYANCTIGEDSILRKYIFSLRDDMLHVALTEIDSGGQKEVLSFSESIYRRARCENTR